MDSFWEFIVSMVRLENVVWKMGELRKFVEVGF